MEQQKTIAIAITGHFYTDQRMQRISSVLKEMNFHVLLVYRPFVKSGNIVKNTELKDIDLLAIKPLFNSGILFYLWFNVLLFFKLLFKKIDIFYAVDSDTLAAMLCLSMLKSKPLVYDAHEYFAEVPELQGKSIKKWIWHRLTLAGVKRSKLCITVSDSLAKALELRYYKPFSVIRNVPFYHQEPKVVPFHSPTIIYQGALNKGRELELLIEAMKELPQFKLLLVGEGDLSATLRELAQKLKLTNVEFKGILSPNELKTISAKCFVGYNLLDAQSLSYYYSLSNKYFDYVQAGIPSISSHLPEYEFLNTEYGCGICIMNTKEALVETLLKCYSDEFYYNKLKENALFAAEKLNWNQESVRLKELFEPFN